MAEKAARKPRKAEYLYTRNGWYWLVKKHKGEPIREPLETRDFRVAKERRDKRLKELEATQWGEKPNDHTLNAATVRFSREHFPTLKPSAARRYFSSMKNLLNVFDGEQLKNITKSRLKDFENTRREEDEVSNSTIRRDLYCLSVIYGYCQQWEWHEWNPVLPFLKERGKAGLKEGAPRERYLTHREEQLILSHSRPGMVEKMIVAIDTGLRKEEMMALEWPDVDFRRREINVRAETTKSRRSRSVPLQERTLLILKRMYAERLPAIGNAQAYVFLTEAGDRYSPNSSYFWEGVQVAAQRAGLVDLEWHDLRRTCGCRLLQDRKMSMEEVAKWLGHSSVKVTEKHYAFLAKDALHKRLRATKQRKIRHVVSRRRPGPGSPAAPAPVDGSSLADAIAEVDVADAGFAATDSGSTNGSTEVMRINRDV